MTTLEIERAKPEDVGAIVDLLQSIYLGTPIGREFEDPGAARERWLHVNTRQPSAAAIPAWVVRAGARIVAHVGAVEADAVIDGSSRRIAWARDLAVDPAARGSGLGSRLIESLVARYGVVFLGGMNDRVRRIYRRLGYRDNGDLPFYVRVMRADVAADAVRVPGAARPAVVAAMFAAARWRRPSRPRGEPRVEEVRSFDGFDALWESAERGRTRVIRRSAALMTWRYLAHPTHRYRVYAARSAGALRGCAVVRSGLSRGVPAGFLVELIADDQDGATHRELLAKVHAEFARTDAAFLRCVALDPPLQRALAGAGWIPAPSPIGWMVAELDGHNSAFERAGWMLNGGDSDFDLI